MALLAGEDGAGVILRQALRIGLVEAVVGPEAPVRREIIASLGPGSPTPDVPTHWTRLRDVGEQLSQRLPVVDVPVQGEFARVDAAPALDPPRREIRVLRARVRRVAAGAGRVLPIDVTDDVGAPGEILAPLAEIEPRLELRQAGGLTFANVVCRKCIRPVCSWYRALHRRELQLHGEWCARGAQVLVEEHAREPPADLTARAVPRREGDVRQGDGHLGEARRPDLADAHRRAAVRQVGENEAAADLRLLVPERWHTVEGPEEIELDGRPWRPLAEHWGAVEREVQARVPEVAVGVNLVGCRLVRWSIRDRRVLSLSERDEPATVSVQGRVDEPADGERLPLSQPDDLPGGLLGGSGTCPSQDGDHDCGEPRERCHSLSHDSPLV